jgi:hypothetical protein
MKSKIAKKIIEETSNETKQKAKDYADNLLNKKETALDWFNNQLDDILQLYPSEWEEIQKAFIEAKKRECKENNEQ